MSRRNLTVLAVALVLCAGPGCGGGGAPASSAAAGQKQPAPSETASRPDAASEAELKRLEGTWVTTSHVIDGTPQPQPRGGTRISIRGNTFAKEALGETFEKGTLKLGSTKKPSSLDLSPTEGRMKGRTFLCIYELEGAVLRYCCKSRGGLRPESFTVGGDLEIVTLRRAKPKE
jgi:uncharacterized protein (TIGR03067 family)